MYGLNAFLVKDDVHDHAEHAAEHLAACIPDVAMLMRVSSVDTYGMQCKEGLVHQHIIQVECYQDLPDLHHPASAFGLAHRHTADLQC